MRHLPANNAFSVFMSALFIAGTMPSPALASLADLADNINEEVKASQFVSDRNIDDRTGNVGDEGSDALESTASQQPEAIPAQVGGDDAGDADDVCYTYRLIVEDADGAPSIIRDGDVELGRYGDIVLLGFDDADQMESACGFYKDVSALVIIDGAVGAASEDEGLPQMGTPQSAELTKPVSVSDNPLSALDDAVEEEKAKKAQEKTDSAAFGVSSQETQSKETDDPVIALIDTGADSDVKVLERASVLEGDGIDNNGHGTLMARTIYEENADAQIISIKALDDTGHGSASAVYAAIELAIEKDAKIINCSFAGPANEGNALIERAVKDALDHDVVVVAAAGNGGFDASKITPANIDGVFTVGAVGEDGNVLESSNRGACVDVYMRADSTSYAAARVSGVTSANIGNDWKTMLLDQYGGVDDGSEMGSEPVPQPEDSAEGEGVNTSAVTIYYKVSGTTLYMRSSSASGYSSSFDTSHGWLGSAYSKITTVNFETSIAPTTCDTWFSNCTKLTTINNLSNLSTSNVTSMKDMFYQCSSLTSLSFPSAFNTSKVTNMSNMFGYCYKLTSVSFSSNFNTSSVTSMGSMFAQCKALTSLSLPTNFNTSNVTDMNAMFQGCQALTSLSFPTNFKTSKCTDMSLMFASCSALTGLSLSTNFNTANVTSMKDMFSNCSALKSLSLSSNFNTSKCTNMSYMFYKCSALTALTFPANFNTSAVTNMLSMFYGCDALKSVSLPQSFSFKGACTIISYYALLPDPPTSNGYTGKWINSSVSGASAVTATDLRDNYNGSSTTGNYARGTYVWDQAYTVTFKTGNTSMGTQNFTGTAALTGVSSLNNAPVNSTYGWSFYGWATSTNTTTRSYTDGQSVTPTANMTLYAIYSRTIPFKYYASTSATSITTSNRTQYYYNTSTTAASAESISTYALYAQSSYSWAPLGWVTSTSSSSASVSQTGSTTTTVTPGTTTNPTYYAIYSRTATLAYNSNGGSGTTTSTTGTQKFVASQSAAQSLSMTLAANNFTRSGYGFNKWAAGSASGTQYSASTSYTFPNTSWSSSSSYTMYATWTGNSYSVAFNANGGSGTMSTQTGFTYGTAKALSSNSFSAPTASGGGWSFQGWATSQAHATAGTVDYSNGGSMSTGTTTSGDTVTLYAVWKRTVAFKSGTSAGTTTNITQLWNGSAGVAITSPTAATCTDVSGWTELGWRADTSASTASVSYNISFSPTATTYYAVYSHTATFNSGSGNSSVNTSNTVYYNSNNNWAVSAPAPTTISGWTALGWRDDTTAGAKEYGSASAASISGTGTTYTFYAAYSRTVTFYSGVGRSSTSTATQYYNSNGSSSAVTSPTPTAIAASGDRPAWTTLGWRADTTASTATVNSATSFTPSATTYYAVYSGNIVFKSGQNKATSTNVSGYYNAYGAWSSITSATQANSTDISGWTERGWRPDASSADYSVAYNTSFTPTAFVYYGAYSRTITFYSGVNKATTNTATQYYNSGNAATTYSAVTSPTLAAIAASGDRPAWTALGWRADTSATTATVSSATSFTPSATTYYAVYSGNIVFKSGQNKATSTNVSGYYNSNNVWSSITSATQANSTDITGWTERGWRENTTSADRTVQYGTSFTPSAFVYYGAYSRTITFYSGENKATTNTATQYYNSGNASTTYSAVTSPTPAAIAASGDRPAWTTLGWRADTSASTATVSSASSFTPSVTTYYAVYSGNVVFKSGINKATSTNVSAYYNSYNVWSSITAASQANSADISGWNERGWRLDASLSDRSIQYGASITPTAFVYYGAYSRTITFYSGINSATSENATQYYNSGNPETTVSAVTTPTPAAIAASGDRPAWTAVGWRADTSASTTTITPGMTIAAGTTAYYAVYSGNIAFKSGLDKATTTNVAGYYNSYNNWSTVNAPTASDCADITNWTELGWRADTSAADKTTNFTGAVSPTTFVYYAVYSRNVAFKHGISSAQTTNATRYYNTNGPYSNITSPTAATCADITGWTELGWRPDSAATTAEMGFGVTFAPGAYTYYAVYSRDVNITYTNGGGSGTAPANTVSTQYYNSAPSITTPSFLLAANTFTRPHYTFKQWSIGQQNTTYSSWTPGVSDSTSKSTAAQWEGISYSVAFNGNGGSGTMGNETGFVYDTPKALSPNTFSAPTAEGGGWYFAGWATSVENATAGTVDYADGADMSQGGSNSGDVVNLYAVWKRTVEFKSGQNASSSASVTQRWNGSAGVAITSPSSADCVNISGWDEIGWRSDTSAAESQVGFATSFAPTAATYYAVYDRMVTFHSGAGTSAATNTATQYRNSNGAYSLTIPAAPADIDTWAVSGWSGDVSAFTAEYAASGTVTDDCGSDLYAVYSRTLSIVYEADDGTGSAPADSTCVQNYNGNGSMSTVSFTLAQNSFTREGYSFDRWDLGDAGDQYVAWQPAVADIVTSKTARALWRGVGYSVAFDGNGGSGAMGTQAGFVYGTPQALPTCSFFAPTANGGQWEFAGWATTLDRAQAGTVDYSDGADMTYGTAQQDTTVTLFAVWKRTVTFESGENGEAAESSNQFFGAEVPLPDDPADIDGWNFAGWKADDVASVPDYTGSDASPDVVNLEAVYTRDVTTSFESGALDAVGTDPSDVEQSQYYNSAGNISTLTVTLPENPYARDGFSFQKWNVGDVGSVYAWTPGISEEPDLVVVAEWETDLVPPSGIDFEDAPVAVTGVVVPCLVVAVVVVRKKRRDEQVKSLKIKLL